MGNVDWITPFPTPTGDDVVTGDDDAATSTDDEDTFDDVIIGDDATAGGGTDDTNTANDDRESDDFISNKDDDNATDDDDGYGPSKSTKTNKPYYPSKESNDVTSGGKTHKPPNDNWSYDDGQHDSVSGKSAKAFGKSGKNGKAFGKSSKGSQYGDDGVEEYSRREPRLFSETSHNGENVR